jgi:hypothetical protein
VAVTDFDQGHSSHSFVATDRQTDQAGPRDLASTAGPFPIRLPSVLRRPLVVSCAEGQAFGWRSAANRIARCLATHGSGDG